ncbi:hypothetical protein CLV24_13133 [Pontibacter ummariensis]|uniref:Uncharacterized protein n=1 Tax=Pontibacter ummariensis TaxID=1610492 RepID=A0A239KSL6_9BACT|nr:hypothetical protein CLV24_13133 [Pontibacter ummariensis]SNT21171.1 hypothetical protein SAMN06296052_13133 [Pontibacter ummariensis]
MSNLRDSLPPVSSFPFVGRNNVGKLCLSKQGKKSYRNAT